MGAILKLNSFALDELAARLKATRKSQGLSQSEAAAVCGVSVSFVRDAESAPQSCSLGLLIKLITGLGLSMAVDGLAEIDEPKPAHAKAPR